MLRKMLLDKLNQADMDRNLIFNARAIISLLVVLACINSNDANYISNCSEKGTNSLKCYLNCTLDMNCPMRLPGHIKNNMVKELTFNGQMDTIPPKTFMFFRNLLHLNGSNCQIKIVHFTNQSRLIQLDLSHNHINELPAEGFIGFFRLAELDLSYNAIETIHSNAFDGVRKLKKLNLSHNQIKSFEINNMNNLKILLLNNNFFINYNTIQNVSSLKQLDISNNPMKYAHHDNENDIFVNLKNLTKLILKSVNLNEADDAFFESLSNLPNLEYIDISDNDWESRNLKRILKKFDNLILSNTEIRTNFSMLTKNDTKVTKIVYKSSSTVVSNTPGGVVIGLLSIPLLILSSSTFVILKRRRAVNYHVASNEAELGVV